MLRRLIACSALVGLGFFVARALSPVGEAGEEIASARPRRGLGSAGRSSRTSRRSGTADLHTGMMGDETEEQNLGQTGDPAARISEADVQAAFGRDNSARPSGEQGR